MKNKANEIQQQLGRQNLCAFCWIIGWCNLNLVNTHNLAALGKPLQQLQNFIILKPAMAGGAGVFVLISSGRFLGALPDHYANAWVESGELRLLCADSFSRVSKFYLANRPESARRRAVDLFIQDILQTINDTRSKVTSVSVSRLPVH